MTERGSSPGDVIKKPRFAFKKKAGAATVPEEKLDPISRAPKDVPGAANAPLIPTLPADQDAAGTQPSAQVALRGMNNRRITLDQVIASSSIRTSQRTGFSLVLEDINGCLIDLRRQDTSRDDEEPILTALYGANVRDSVVLVPEDMAGSVMLDRMERVVVVAGCQQVCYLPRGCEKLLIGCSSFGYIHHSGQRFFCISRQTLSSNIRPLSGSDRIRIP